MARLTTDAWSLDQARKLAAATIDERRQILTASGKLSEQDARDPGLVEAATAGALGYFIQHQLRDDPRETASA